MKKINNIENDIKRALKISNDENIDKEIVMKYSKQIVDDKYTILISCIIKPYKLTDDINVLLPMIEKFEKFEKFEKSWCRWFYG